MRDWPEIQKWEITSPEFCWISGDWGELGIPSLPQMSLMKYYWMLQKLSLPLKIKVNFFRHKKGFVWLNLAYILYQISIWDLDLPFYALKFKINSGNRGFELKNICLISNTYHSKTHLQINLKWKIISYTEKHLNILPLFALDSLEFIKHQICFDTKVFSTFHGFRKWCYFWVDQLNLYSLI